MKCVHLSSKVTVKCKHPQTLANVCKYNYKGREKYAYKIVREMKEEKEIIPKAVWITSNNFSLPQELWNEQQFIHILIKIMSFWLDAEWQQVKVQNNVYAMLIEWQLCCLIAGLNLLKAMLLKCSITVVFTCPLLSWCRISSPFWENNNILFLFPFHIFMALSSLCFFRLQR